MDSNFNIYTLLQAILGVIIIPALVAWYSSDLRVAQMHRKRDHHLEIVKSFEDYNDRLTYFASIGVTGFQHPKFQVNQSKDLSDLLYYKWFKEHIDSGYTEIWRSWQELKKLINEHNRAHATLMNEIVDHISKITENYGVMAIFPDKNQVLPTFYLNLEKTADCLFDEVKYRFEGHPPWRFTEPKCIPASFPTQDLEGHQWQSQGETFFTWHNSDISREVIDYYKRVIDEKYFDDTIQSIISSEELCEKKREEFSEILEREREKIQAGGEFKGICEICREYGLFSRLKLRSF